MRSRESLKNGDSLFKTKVVRVSSVIDLAFSNSVTKLDLLLEWSDKVEPVLINTVAYEIESKYEGKPIAVIATKGNHLLLWMEPTVYLWLSIFLT